MSGFTASYGTTALYGPTSTLTTPILGRADDVLDYAKELAAAAGVAIAELGAISGSFYTPGITPVFPSDVSAPAISIPALPSFDEPLWNSPAIPQAFTEVLDTTDLDVEPFDLSPPVVTFGTPPEMFAGAIPDAPSVNLTYVDPTLSVSLPAPPDLLQLSVSRFSGMNLPTFSETSPTLNVVEPTIREYTPGEMYSSRLLSGAQDTLLNRITNGGTGLNPDAEQAIWDRGREREARSARDALADLDRMERLGYSLPPGVYLDARVKIQTETDAANRGHSREVMIKAAELELDNVKHALTSAVQLEGSLIQYANAFEQRLFDAARYATEAGVSIYNAKVQAYGNLVEAYRAKVQVYEAQIRAEISKVEAYKAEIEAERTKAEVNTALVQQYKIAADVALSNVEIFKAEIAGIQAKADIERTKVMVFGEQVKGYTAQVNAYTANVEGYRASLQAEQTKQQVYQSSVEAFTARVTAAAKQTEARIEAYKGRIAAKTAEWDGYRATVQGEVAKVEALSSQNKVRADAYQAQVSGTSAYNETLSKQWQAVLDQNQRVSEIGVSAAKANAELYLSSRNLASDAAKVAAQVSGQLGAAAINAFNVSASVSSSESYNASDSSATSNSVGVSYNNSSSNSSSTSTNYNYNASV